MLTLSLLAVLSFATPQAPECRAPAAEQPIPDETLEELERELLRAALVVMSDGEAVVGDFVPAPPEVCTKLNLGDLSDVYIPKTAQGFSRAIFEFLISPQFRERSCQTNLIKAYCALVSQDATKFQWKLSRRAMRATRANFQKAREALQIQKDRFFSEGEFTAKSQGCVDAMKLAERTVSYLEELLVTYNGKMVAPTKKKNIARPFQGPKGNLVVYEAGKGLFKDFDPKAPIVPQFAEVLENGFLTTTRGGSHISAAIGQSGQGVEQDGLFSHQFTCMKTDQGPKCVEALIEDGQRERGFAKSFLDHAGYRVRVMRFKDAEVQRAVSQCVVNEQRSYEKKFKTDHVPYNFSMDSDVQWTSDLPKETARHCSLTVVACASKVLGRPFPLSRTVIGGKSNQVFEKMGVTNKPVVAPSDAQWDPAIEVLADWTNFEAIRPLHYKDAVMRSLIELQEQENPYQFQISEALVALSEAVVDARRSAALGEALPQIHRFLSTKMPENMQSDVVQMDALLRLMSAHLEKVAATTDKAYLKKHGRPMPQTELVLALKKYVTEVDAGKGEASLLRPFFRP